MNWIKNIFSKLETKIFESKLELARKECEELYKKKGNVVVCKYCGQLLPKEESGVIYDLRTKENTYFHEECFEKYENHPEKIEPKSKELLDND